MVLMDGGFGRCLNHDVGTVMKEDPRRSLPAWLYLRGYNQKSATQKGARPWPCQHPNLRCAASRLWEINLCCLQATHSGLCCYSSLNGDRATSNIFIYIDTVFIFALSKAVKTTFWVIQRCPASAHWLPLPIVPGKCGWTPVLRPGNLKLSTCLESHWQATGIFTWPLETAWMCGTVYICQCRWTHVPGHSGQHSLTVGL